MKQVFLILGMFLLIITLLKRDLIGEEGVVIDNMIGEIIGKGRSEIFGIFS
jgi:hypothetical protein